MWSRKRAGLAAAGAAAAITAAVTAAVACLSAAAAPAVPVRTVPVRAVPAAPAGPVVALGDSYTAGYLLPLDPAAKPAGCLRSSKAYPVLVARALKMPLVDAACGGAGVKEMTGAQHTYLGTNPPQLSALSASDSLVLLTLGGDDMGFWSTLDTCMALSITNPFGSPCRRHFTSGGTDQLAARVRAEAAKVTAVLDDIGTLAPRARIVLTGYPDLFPQGGGCWPAVPITDGDIAYLRSVERLFNDMLAADATAAGATFADTYTTTIGHDVCQDAKIKDVEGLVPTSLAVPFHPNARGQAAMAAAILAAVRG